MNLDEFYTVYEEYYSQYPKKEQEQLDSTFKKLYIKELENKFSPKEIQK